MFQYLSSATEADGNYELIWGMRTSGETINGGEEVTIKMPSYVVTNRMVLCLAEMLRWLLHFTPYSIFIRKTGNYLNKIRHFIRHQNGIHVFMRGR